jgi:tRNA dimethylallyltransferase
VEEYFSPGDFEREASILLEKLFQKHEVVIATGGSGLYLKALIEGLDEMPEANLALREKLNDRLQKEGLWALFSELKNLDPAYAAQVDSKNPQRVIRALEVCLSTGKPYSEFRLAQKPERPFQVIKICLERPREELYARIDLRMDQMLSEGLLQEAKTFEDKQHLYALKTLGYKEIYGFLRGEYDEAEMIRLLKRNNRHYAKKQMTWFRNQDAFTYLHPSNAFVEILKLLEA